jgi:CRP/FNR family transcriptional regulator, cyclic AMP receptor protein
MIENNPDTNRFKRQMRNSLLKETKNSQAIKIARHNNVYQVGDEIKLVYFIESGEVKLVTKSTEGKECTLVIHSAGDIFGELCLSGSDGRQETATAMKDTVLKQVPCDKFLERLTRDALLVGFIKYLTVRIADQQVVITNLATGDAQQRLGQTLLQIARKHGKKDRRSIRLELRIFHGEWASMVGTTRPRVSLFMQRFGNLGLIEFNEERQLLIKEHKLVAYLAGKV